MRKLAVEERLSPERAGRDEPAAVANLLDEQVVDRALDHRLGRRHVAGLAQCHAGLARGGGIAAESIALREPAVRALRRRELLDPRRQLARARTGPAQTE